MSLPIILLALILAAGLLAWGFRGKSPDYKGTLRAVLGFAICALASAAYDYLIRFACVMDPAGCTRPPFSLYLRHLLQEEGLAYMLLMAIGGFLLWSGLRMRRSAD